MRIISAPQPLKLETEKGALDLNAACETPTVISRLSTGHVYPAEQEQSITMPPTVQSSRSDITDVQ
ncbi:hypothetical protein ACSS6W_000833 [Trichoderma asperelloides]